MSQKIQAGRVDFFLPDAPPQLNSPRDYVGLPHTSAANRGVRQVLARIHSPPEASSHLCSAHNPCAQLSEPIPDYAFRTSKTKTQNSQIPLARSRAAKSIPCPSVLLMQDSTLHLRVIYSIQTSGQDPGAQPSTPAYSALLLSSNIKVPCLQAVNRDNAKQSDLCAPGLRWWRNVIRGMQDSTLT